MNFEHRTFNVERRILKLATLQACRHWKFKVGRSTFVSTALKCGIPLRVLVVSGRFSYSEANLIGLTAATVNKALGHLERLGIVRELTTQQRKRLFSCPEYIEIMNSGIGPSED